MAPAPIWHWTARSRSGTVPGMTSLTIGIVGERRPDFPPHVATDAALAHTAEALGIDIEARWIATDDVSAVEDADAIWCAPGSPYRSLEGALAALRHGRERGVPTLGTCGGCQHMLLEFARNVLGFADATHAEYDPNASLLFVTPLECVIAGKAMRVRLEPGSGAAALYGGALEVEEQYYCNFGLNPAYRGMLEDGGLRVTGVDADGDTRVFELDDHPFYVATLYVPQTRSEPGRPHPVVTGFVRAALAAAVRA
jgi:CTP synthase (UTP-ammonia lyase)